jgi:demethylspheroidene O-methyltransferase
VPDGAILSTQRQLGWRYWRDRLLSNGRFQRWALRTPLVRLMARRQAARLFELCAGFVHSQVLYSSVQLGLLEVLRDGALPLQELQERCALAPARLKLLLSASGALGLTEPRAAGRHGLGPLGAALIGNPAVLAMIEHQPLFYADLREPLALLRGDGHPAGLARFWAYADRGGRPWPPGEAAVADYTALMSSTQALIAEELLGAYPFERHRCVLDVGGGEGAWLMALARRAPALKLMLLDLPAVADRARARLAAAGASVRVYGGDFNHSLPEGVDLITFVRVLHDHDDHAVVRMLRAARRALTPGGALLIAEPMRAVPGFIAAAATYLDFYLLAMGQGRVRSPEEFTELLRRAGFASVRRRHTQRPWQCAVLSARPSGTWCKD